MEKYLFLDIDGVLNHEMWYRKVVQDPELSKIVGYRRDFDPECVARINKIVDETGARVVLSSGWRFNDRIRDICRDVGLPELYGGTPCLVDSLERGEEIREFFARRNIDEKKVKYVIIDDDNYLYRYQLKHFVPVDRWVGFTDKNMEKALKILLK